MIFDYHTWIPIDECERRIARAVAEFRVQRAEEQKLQGKGHGEPGTSLPNRDIPGATGELVAAKTFGIYWGGDMDAWRDRGDVGNWEVRATTHFDGHLICYDADRDDRKLLLVVLKPDFSCGMVKGYLMASVCKQMRWRKPPEVLRPGSKPQFWVPQKELHRESVPFLPQQLLPRERQQNMFAPGK